MFGGVMSLNGTYVYAPTVVRGNGTFNWWDGRFAPGRRCWWKATPWFIS